MGIRPSRYEDENVQENFFLKEHRILPLPPLSPLLSQRIRSMSATGTKVDATMDLLSYFSVGQLDLPDGSNARGFEHLVAHLPGSDKLAEDLSENTKLTPLILAAPDGPPLHWTPDDIDLMQFEQALMLDVTSAPLGLIEGEIRKKQQRIQSQVKTREESDVAREGKKKKKKKRATEDSSGIGEPPLKKTKRKKRTPSERDSGSSVPATNKI